MIRGIRKKLLIECNGCNVQGYPDIDKYLIDTKNETVIINSIYNEHNIVPFCANNGGFGVNTYLFLQYHGFFPVGITLNPYLVHRGAYPDPLSVINHDFTHYRLLDSSYPILEKYFLVIQNQRSIINGQELDINILYGLIYYLFISIHEFYKLHDCNNKHIVVNSLGLEDYEWYLLCNPEYSPESFGIDLGIDAGLTGTRKECITNKYNILMNPSNKNITRQYIDDALIRLTNNFCYYINLFSNN